MTDSDKIEFSFQLKQNLDTGSPVPLHHQLTEGILRELRQGHAAAGKVIPSILNLSQQLGLNRDTVRKAYAALESEQAVSREPGGRQFRVTPEFVRSCSAHQLTAIGMVLPTRMETLLNLQAGSALRTVTGIMDAAAESGFATMVVPLPEEETELDRLKGWLQKILSNLNGLIYLGEGGGRSHEQAFELLLAERSLPQVFISGHRFREHLGIVHVDIETGANAAADYLRELGHRRIALFGAEVPVRRMFQLQTFDRIPALVKALRRHIALPAEDIVTGPRGDAETMERLRRLLASPGRPTAFLCADDEEAKRLIALAAEAGLTVPRDLSVIGYGDTAEAEGISSIRHPWLQSGRSAVGMIAESLRRNLPVNRLDRVLAAPLVIRNTTNFINQP